jgi:hypothetical protein
MMNELKKIYMQHFYRSYLCFGGKLWNYPNENVNKDLYVIYFDKKNYPNLYVYTRFR